MPRSLALQQRWNGSGGVSQHGVFYLLDTYFFSFPRRRDVRRIPGPLHYSGVHRRDQNSSSHRSDHYSNDNAQPVSEWYSIEDFSQTYHALLMGMHWAGGVIILLAGPLQFVKCIRRSYPAVHRWTGRTYLAACAVTAVPGLIYTILYSTRGGIVMDVSFVGYGLAMLGCACMTGWHAWHREIESHRAWATRLYAVGIGSAVYRLLVFPLFLRLRFLDGTAFVTWLNVAAWLFYLPPLALAEVYIRGWCPGCCGAWGDHLRDGVRGYESKTTDDARLGALECIEHGGGGKTEAGLSDASTASTTQLVHATP